MALLDELDPNKQQGVPLPPMAPVPQPPGMMPAGPMPPSPMPPMPMAPPMAASVPAPPVPPPPQPPTGPVLSMVPMSDAMPTNPSSSGSFGGSPFESLEKPKPMGGY